MKLKKLKPKNEKRKTKIIVKPNNCKIQNQKMKNEKPKICKTKNQKLKNQKTKIIVNEKPKNRKMKNQQPKNCKTKLKTLGLDHHTGDQRDKSHFCPVYCMTCCCQGVSHPLLVFVDFLRRKWQVLKVHVSFMNNFLMLCCFK